jgi:Cys-rich repeat protein
MFTRCGEPCGDEGARCGNEIGDGMSCVGGVWMCVVHPPLGPGCNRVCERRDPTCDGEDPAGCSADDECASGERCGHDGTCRPSTCACTENGWVCTADCGGGVCLPGGGECLMPAPGVCRHDSDCPAGTSCATNRVVSVCAPFDGDCFSDADCGAGEVCDESLTHTDHVHVIGHGICVCGGPVEPQAR